MDDMNHKDLKERLGQYAVEPDEKLWQKITTTLADSARAGRMRKRYRFGLMVISLSIVMSGLHFLTTHAPGIIEKAASDATTHASKDRDKLQDRDKSHTAMPLTQPAVSPPGDLRAHDKFTAPTAKALQPRITNALSRVGRATEYGSVAGDGSTVLTADMGSSHETPTGSADTEVLSDTLTSAHTTPPVPAILASKDASPATSQEDGVVNIPPKRHNLNIYFTVMPTLGYQRIEPNTTDNLIVESIQRISAFSPDRLGVRAELGMEIPIAARVRVFGGLLYFQRHQTITYVEKQVIGSEIIAGPNGEVINQPEFGYTEKTFEYEVQNVGLQAGLNYQLSARRVLQTIGTGVEFHAALNKKRQSNPDFTGNPSYYIFYNVYYRVQYPADTKLRAVFQPTLNYSFYIDDNVSAPFYVRPYGLGLNLGFTYNF